jgi:hypothetical protein
MFIITTLIIAIIIIIIIIIANLHVFNIINHFDYFRQ